MGANNDVVVERIDVIVSGPCTLHLERFELRHTRGQRRPQHGVEQLVLHLEVEAFRVFVFGRRDAANKPAALRPEPGAGRIDDQRAARQCGRAGEVEHAALAGFDRQRDARCSRQRGGARTGRIDQRRTGDPAAVRQDNGLDTPAGALDAADFGLAPNRAERLRLAAERAHQAIGIEPAFA